MKTKFSTKTNNMKPSMIRELVASTKGIPGLISLAGGFPSPSTFPSEELAQIFKDTILSDGKDILQYGASGGDIFLKETLLEMEGLTNVTPEEMLITSGSTNGIFLFTETFLNEGDVIISEAPSFLGSLVAFEGMGADLIGVEIDSFGMKPELLEKTIIELRCSKKEIKFIYMIPDFQNPSGVTMSLKRRIEILEIAIKYDILVLEDNPYGELRYTGSSPKSLFRLAREEYNNDYIVTSVKSFSKILGPGMRLAYCIGNQEIIEKMVSWMQKVNVSTDCISQRVVANFIKKGKFAPQIEKIKSIYRPQYEAMLSSLEENMPKEIKWIIPEGGMFVWLELPEYLSGDELFEKAKKEKVAFIPGSKFYPTGTEKYNVLRLNFSYPTTEQIIEGVKRLSKIIRESLK